MTGADSASPALGAPETDPVADGAREGTDREALMAELVSLTAKQRAGAWVPSHGG